MASSSGLCVELTATLCRQSGWRLMWEETELVSDVDFLPFAFDIGSSPENARAGGWGRPRGTL